MGMDLGPDIDYVVRVHFQLYLLQSFLERAGGFSTLTKAAKNVVQRYGGLSAVLHRPVDGLPQPTKGSQSQWLCKSQMRRKNERERSHCITNEHREAKAGYHTLAKPSESLMLNPEYHQGQQWSFRPFSIRHGDL